MENLPDIIAFIVAVVVAMNKMERKKEILIELRNCCALEVKRRQELFRHGRQRQGKENERLGKHI